MSAIIHQLNALIEACPDDVNAWVLAAYKKAPPFFYTSVDLRHAGFKLAPVDTNLFPAGFNNLSLEARQRGVEATRRYRDAYFPEARNVVIVPENHSRNLMYFESLATLRTLLESAGFTVELGSIQEELESPYTVESQTGISLVISPMKRNEGRLELANGFIPDLVIVNNDFTSGSPAMLRGVTQPIVPPPGMGWYRRKKSEHFTAYAAIVQEFGAAFSIDPWLISAVFHECGQVDFKLREGIECVALAVDRVVHQVRRKYEEYGIRETPYVFIKADQGTYGMGIMTARSGDELYELNKKNRNKMQTIKEGTANSNVIIQEGVPTIDRVRGQSAEPMLYLINGESLGGAYRFHPEKDAMSNLNATGMAFAPLCDDTESRVERGGKACSAFCLVARLAALAAAREHQTWLSETSEAKAG